MRPGSHIADLIINTRAGTKEAACKGRRVWQPGLKCPLMNFFGTCILATHFITSWCSWTGHTVIYPRWLSRFAFFGGGRRNVPTLLSQGCVCISLLCFADEKGTHGAGSQGPDWLAGAGPEGTAVGARKVGGRLSWSWAAHEFRCQHRRPPCSLPSAPWVWVLLSGLLLCMTLIWIRWK